MGINLEAAREDPPKTGWSLLIATSAYGLKVEDLGIARKTYISEGFIRGKKEGTFGVFVWSVLTEEASEEGLEKPTLRKVSQYARELREEVAGFGLPFEVRTSFVRSGRELALRDHLEGNKIGYEI
ncbi:MAG: hypothetical protein Q8P92_05105 [Candidatus Daviesbacteria bacterium]|nr:hypothetical protein [Candidatus Daviesbacteria bacterium]